MASGEGDVDVDPRVQWALDHFDYDGIEPNSVVKYYGPVVAGTLVGALAQPIVNFSRRMPLYAGLPKTLAAAATGFLASTWIRDQLGKKRAQEIAAVKHYIKTHPEHFIEAEKKKFGDSCVFYAWNPIR